MLTFEIKTDSSIPLYRQLYEFIKTEIIEENLSADSKLPSKRNLAKNLGISVLTVETAYEQLCAEGFIYSLPKKGFFVADIKGEVFSKSASMVPPQMAFVPTDTPNVPSVNFSDNQIDPESFPFSVWAKILRDLLNQRQTDVIKNSSFQGIEELRNAIAKHLHDFRGMQVYPQQIIVGAGTEYLYTLLIQLLGFSKTYAVEDPCHKKIIKIYESFNVNNVQIPMDSKGIIIDELNKCGADVVHISPSHHFPTGIIMPIPRRYELLGWASEKENRYLIEDDYDSEFRFTGKPLPTLQSIDMAGKVIYMNTFTKTLSSTVRISYMVLPLQLMELFKEKLSFYSCTVPVIDQYTLATFIKDGYFERHINRMRKVYSQKREAFITAIKKYDVNKEAKLLEGDSGLHFILEIKQEKVKNFKRELLQKNIKLNSVSEYFSRETEEGANQFVLNYSAIPLENIESTVKLLFS